MNGTLGEPSRPSRESRRGETSTYDLDENGLIAVRIPLLSQTEALQLYSCRADYENCIRSMLQQRPELRVALWLASPSLWNAVSDWLDGKEFKNPSALVKTFMYIVRMATRPTPFGFFSAIGTVHVGSDTTLRLQMTRLDMHETRHGVALCDDGAYRKFGLG